MHSSRSALPAPRLFGIAAVAAPVLFLVSDVAYVTAGGGVNDGVLGGTIGVWSCILFMVSWVGISRSLEAGAPRGSQLLLVVGLTGFTAGAAFNADAISNGYLGESFMSASPSGGADLIGILGFLPWGWCAPLSFVIAGVLVWRTRSYPAWNAVLLIVGGLAFVAGRPAGIDPLVIVADSILVLALIPIGVAIFGGPRVAPTAPEVASSVSVH